MDKYNIFLSLYCVPDDSVVDIDCFLEYSKQCMTKEIAAKYAEKFAKFTDELMEYAKSDEEDDYERQ